MWRGFPQVAEIVVDEREAQAWRGRHDIGAAVPVVHVPAAEILVRAILEIDVFTVAMLDPGQQMVGEGAFVPQGQRLSGGVLDAGQHAVGIEQVVDAAGDVDAPGAVGFGIEAVADAGGVDIGAVRHAHEPVEPALVGAEPWIADGTQQDPVAGLAVAAFVLVEAERPVVVVGPAMPETKLIRLSFRQYRKMLMGQSRGVSIYSRK